MTTDYGLRTTDHARWRHRWAVLTVCATLPLLILGAEVTTKKVGMADPQGFRVPWHMLTVPALLERGLGFLIEHSHRLAGFIVGSCVIVLAVGLWRQGRWLRWLGLAALAGITFQGLLGGFRVQLNAILGPSLALIHGSFAPVVFSLLVGLAVLTSRGWTRAAAEPMPDDAPLRHSSLLLAAVVYLQILLGALVRHTDFLWGPRLHLAFAFVVVALVAWLAKAVFQMEPPERRLRRPVLLLAGLVALQVVLGLEAWLAKFVAAAEWTQLRPLSLHPDLVRSVHYLVGALIFATAVVVSLQAHRKWLVVSREAVPGHGEATVAVAGETSWNSPRTSIADHSVLTTHHLPAGQLGGTA